MSDLRAGLLGLGDQLGMDDPGGDRFSSLSSHYSSTAVYLGMETSEVPPPPIHVAILTGIVIICVFFGWLYC